MPRLENAVPKYRKHRASGQAVVRLAGKDHYLGRYNSQASRMLNKRLVGERLVAGRPIDSIQYEAITITELIGRYWKHAQSYYRHSDGSKTDTAGRMRPALRELRALYGNLAAADFGPISLKNLQRQFAELGHSRGYVNENIDRIRRMFRWGVSEETVNESTLRRLESVQGLRKGKTTAPDHPPVPPVDDAIADATLAELTPTVRAMVQIQRYTGARPGEICIMRATDIDQTHDVWLSIPERHKTEHHGKTRKIVIGPRAQSILAPFLDRQPDEYCFNAAETNNKHLVVRHAKRKMPMSCGNKPGKRKANRKLAPQDHYSNDSYRRAIHRACDRVFAPPPPLACKPNETDAARVRRLTAKQKEELAKWQSDHRWSPNQLRHTMGTQTREHFGIEAVAAVLGHSRTDTSEIYALRNIKLAAEVAKAIG